MARRWPEARAWLMALITETPASQATANPVPRRIAWLALLTLELVEPSTAALDPWLAELRGLVWLPPSTTEHSMSCLAQQLAALGCQRPAGTLRS